MVAIQQAIVAATRPRSFLSPLLIAIGVYLHRKYGSEDLIDLLHAFGFCCSYEEARRYQWSALFGPSPFPPDKEAFIQFAFDNADHNVITLDGHNTFHSMGGIRCVTPRPETDSSVAIKRIQKDPGSIVAGMYGKVPYHPYTLPPNTGLVTIKVKDMSVPAFKIASHLTSIVCLDHVWLASSAIELSPVPGWAGFNQLVTDSQDTPFSDVSDVVTLPFINLNPSDLSTIYTAIKFAQKEATLYNRDYCLITFDQPLFVKAVDIVSASDDLAGSVIIRLGGLHMTFSFMGSDGYIMSGSGMEQLWGTTYASGSIAQMLTGHAYSRALRANILTAQAIVSCVLSQSADVFADVDKLTLQRTWDDLLHEAISLQEALDSKEFTKLAHTVSICLSDAKQLGRTAMLWITKLERVMTLLRFIRAERTGDWALHIKTVREMLPMFHAAGHTAYAKSAQLYLQQMERLESVLPPTDFEKYTNNGYFTVRRTNRFWAGIWTNMTIEQVVMKNLKGRHGVTRGRGITDSTLAYFTSALPACVSIMEAIEELSGVRTESSEQHAQHRDHRDLRPARQKRDADDRMAFVHWLTTHNPFAAQFNKDNRVCSVFSGVSADETINCERAHAIGSFRITLRTSQ